MDISNLVVARYLDGRTLKGVTRDFSPNRAMRRNRLHESGLHYVDFSRYANCKRISCGLGEPENRQNRRSRDELGPAVRERRAFRCRRCLCSYGP